MYGAMLTLNDLLNPTYVQVAKLLLGTGDAAKSLITFTENGIKTKLVKNVILKNTDNHDILDYVHAQMKYYNFYRKLDNLQEVELNPYNPELKEINYHFIPDYTLDEFLQDLTLFKFHETNNGKEYTIMFMVFAHNSFSETLVSFSIEIGDV